MKARFTDFPQDSNWVKGFVGQYIFEAKLYDDGSEFGINGGRVSKLWVRESFVPQIKPSWDSVIINYDRGWDIEPKPGTFAYEVLEAILELCENAPKRFETA